MWDYSFMFPSILVLFILLVFFFSRPRLPIRMNRTFLAILLLELTIMVTDIISSEMDANYRQYARAVLYLMNALYFVLYIGRTYLFFRFTTDALGLGYRENRVLHGLLGVPFLIGEILSLSSFATGAVFRIDETGYHSGPCYNVLYICFLFYILASLVLLSVYRQRLNPYQLVSSFAFNLMLLAGNIMRILFPRLLVMNTFCLAAMLTIYLAFQNPDLYLSDRGDAFNMRGLRALLSEYYSRSDYCILGFSILNYNQERSILGGRQTDQCLKQISQPLISTYPRFLPFYLRSGRFALIGPASAQWREIIDAINARFQNAWTVNNTAVYLNVSIMLLSPNTRLDSADRIVNNLTIAFEAAGRPDSSSGDDPLGMQTMQQLDAQVDILRSIENALERDKVEAFLQPVFDSQTRRIVAAEALARIRDATGGIISPALFIPIAEKTGYINRLGEAVFEKTCAFIRENSPASLGLSWINVNLSPIQCMQGNLCDRFSAILEKYGVSAEQIHLEVTEQSIADFALLENQINRLRNRGFQFVLDDYGSGYSNLTRVKHYPFVNVKLDMEVVWDYFRDRDPLIPTIVQGFRQTGFSITAEGIETEEMADALTAIGCEFLQGYLFDKPLEMSAFVAKYRIR
jgi:EAL domain-containing protein (putative c-di-GMP-specific phosphodiesterase class I)